MKTSQLAEQFKKDKELFEKKKQEVKPIVDVKNSAHDSFEDEIKWAIRNFITNNLHQLAVDYAHRHHEDGVTVTDLIKRGVIVIKKEVEASK